MATYHLRVKTVSRGGGKGRGRSVVAAAAYRSGERLIDAATGAVKHYPDRADRVQFAGIFAPPGAPGWARDRGQLWNAVERLEARRDATLAREIELSLPHELTDRQQLQLVRDFCREQLMRRGLAVDVAIHRPEPGSDSRNYHAHLLIAERQLGPGGFAAGKDRSLSRKATLYGWRSSWATLCNRYLAAAGHASRIDHRSFRARGIRDRKPTRPLGPVAAAMQRRGMVTPRGEQLRRIQARNMLRQGWQSRAGEVFGPARQERGQTRPPPRQQRRAAPLPAVLPAASVPVTPVKAVRMTVDGAGFRAAASGMVAVPRLSTALASLAAVVPERAASEAAWEMCSRGPPTGRDPPPGERAGSALMADRDSDGEAEPCSYEAEAKGIMLIYARQIDGIRQSNMPRDLMEAAIRAVRDAQRAALAAMRERRYWRRQRPVATLVQ